MAILFSWLDYFKKNIKNSRLFSFEKFASYKIKNYLCTANLMVGIAQLVRVSDCGPEGRGFDPHFPPSQRDALGFPRAFLHFMRC